MGIVRVPIVESDINIVAPIASLVLFVSVLTNTIFCCIAL